MAFNDLFLIESDCAEVGFHALLPHGKHKQRSHHQCDLALHIHFFKFSLFNSAFDDVCEKLVHAQEGQIRPELKEDGEIIGFGDYNLEKSSLVVTKERPQNFKKLIQDLRICAVKCIADGLNLVDLW